MTDYETPMMRDISKAILQWTLGLLIGLGVFFFLFFPFSLTVFGQHCMEETSYSIPQWIFRSLTIQC